MTSTESTAPAAAPRPFAASPNRLFSTRVRHVTRLSPGFLRLTLHGDRLTRFAAHGHDQRVKILLPAPAGSSLPAELDEDLLDEADWRRRWRDLSPSRRPALRSYTISAARPDRAEVDVDVHLHDHPGPAARWAARAAPGDRLLLSGPDASRDGRSRSRSVQWNPGAARSAWIGGDESAAPAVAGILDALVADGEDHRSTTAVVEVGDPEDAAWLRDRLAPHDADVVLRGSRPRGEALHRSAADWLRCRAGAGRLDAAYAWTASESTQVAALRRRFRDAGLAPEQIQAQGYWCATPPASRSPITPRGEAP